MENSLPLESPYLNFPSLNVPSLDESRDVKEFIAGLESRVSVLQIKAKQLRFAERVVDYQLSELRAFIRRHKAILAPERRLPPEILSQIFIGCREEPYPLRERDVDFRDEFDYPNCRVQLALGQVCSRWRAVALSTPLLWSSLHGRSRAFGQALWTTPMSASLLKHVWLPRSKQAPLTINGDYAWLNSEIDGETALDLLFTVTDRWSRVILQLNRSQMDLLLRALRSLPRLLSLEVCGSEFTLGVPPSEHRVIVNAPRLRHVWLVGFPSPATTFPLSQLTEFACNSLTWEDHAAVLSTAVNLQTYHVSVDSMHWSLSDHAVTPAEMDPSGTLVLSQSALHTVSLETRECSRFFATVSLPALMVLSINLRRRGDLDGFSEFLSRSGCKVTKLMVSDLDFRDHEQDLNACLDYLSSLEDLALTKVRYMSRGLGLLSRMTRNANALPIALPSLRRLHVESGRSNGVFGDAFSQNMHAALVDMVASRLHAQDAVEGMHGQAIEHLVLVLEQVERHHPTTQRGRIWKEGGFDIVIRQPMGGDLLSETQEPEYISQSDDSDYDHDPWPPRGHLPWKEYSDEGYWQSGVWAN